VISPWQDLFLICAGFVAGVVGTAGGIASLVSYPALLIVGLPVLGANVANIVALVSCWPGAAISSQRELRGRGPMIMQWSMFALLGGAVGAPELVSSDLTRRLRP
jgi:uncharacterized membrane protein YfcA